MLSVRFLHCKITIFPFVIDIYLCGYSWNYVNILLLLKISLWVLVPTGDSCLNQFLWLLNGYFLILKFLPYLLAAFLLLRRDLFVPINLFTTHGLNGLLLHSMDFNTLLLFILTSKLALVSGSLSDLFLYLFGMSSCFC